MRSGRADHRSRIDGEYCDPVGGSRILSARVSMGHWPPIKTRRRRLPYDLTEPPFVRLLHRQTLDLWDPTEPITLPEAGALLFPDGPVTLHSLYVAAREGRLPVAEHASRYWTTIEAVRGLFRPEPLVPPPPQVTPRPGLEGPRGARRTKEQADLTAALVARRRKAAPRPRKTD